MIQERKQFMALSKIIVLSFVVLFCMLPLVNTNTIVTNFMKMFKADNEVPQDNWEISTVFYDSSVNNGNTPLTEINWDASSLSYSEEETRVITIQINYKNTNSINDYNAGDIKIEIPNLAYKLSRHTEYHDNEGKIIFMDVNVSANDLNHSGYDWDYAYLETNVPSETTISTTQKKVIFRNSKQFSKNTNYEGSIQISYTLKSEKEDVWYLMASEAVDDECESSYNLDLSSKLSVNDSSVEYTSDSMNFAYYRKYSHPWQKKSVSLEKTANKLTNVDNLALNGDYYWVRYDFKHNGSYSTNSGNISSSNHFYPTNGIYYGDIRVVDKLPTSCLVYNIRGEIIQPIDENGTYYFEYSNSHTSSTNSYSVIVGYPKNEFNSENNNLIVTNTASEYGKYTGENEYTYFNDSEITIDVSNYGLDLGNLYNISKNNNMLGYVNPSTMYYQSILSERGYNTAKWYMPITAKYAGKPMTVKIGDDLLYYTDINDNITRIDDDDYYFSQITKPQLSNANGEMIVKNYEYELWVRKAGNTDYELYDTYVNDRYVKTINLTKDDKVVGWYLLIKDLNESIIPRSTTSGSWYRFTTSIVFKNKNIKRTGTIYNFNYLQVFHKDSSGNLILQNPSSLDKYSSDANSLQIPEYDRSHYNNYIERSQSTNSWKEYQKDTIKNNILTYGSFSDSKQNEENQSFSGEYTMFASPIHSSLTSTEFEVFIEDYLDDDINYIHGFELENLLPEGMYLTNTKEELYDKLFVAYYNYDSDYLSMTGDSGTAVYDKNGNKLSRDEVQDILLNNTDIDIDYNYNNTGRIRIKITVDINDNPLIYLHGTDGWSTNTCNKALGIGLKYDFDIPYDSYIEYGTLWENTVSTDFLHQDVNHNDDDTDTDTFNIKNIVGTHLDVSTFAKTESSTFESKRVNVNTDTTYYYKLRARTGTNDVTNLVIYNSIEKYAKDPNMEFIDASKGYKRWQGTFLGVDTSYAASKGYIVKIYYSENEQPGNLSEDDSWKVYDDNVDKTKVKSLAFEYLDSEGRPAVLPANSLTYVLIKMKSPEDESIKTLAYNGCWTEWNAIDSLTGRPVDFITGINSNIVKVALPNSVEPVDIDLTIDKYWKDKNNNLGIRPSSINVKLIPNGDITKAIDIPLGTTNVDPRNSNHWSTVISVPKYDLDSNLIDYTIAEDEIILSNGYRYTSEINDYSVTNTLMKEIELKKNWKDNNNYYLTRPSNVTYKVKQNGSLYKEVIITGDYSTNEWTKIINVPVYNNSNRLYTYTIEEVRVDNYRSNCSSFTCTNTLTGSDSINVSKEWKDNNNSYNTRPSSITIHLLRNNVQYKNITLNSNNDWNSNVEVDKYDSEGREYTYTILEDEVDEYGLVSYNQNTYKVTNTLKTNTNITITKKWIDDSNSNNTRPSELRITLLRNGENYRELTLSGDSDIWTSTIEVPKYDDNQIKYKYTIKEINDDISDEYSDITYSEDELTVTNKLNKNTDLTIKKKWIDHNNEYLTRPENINVKLFRNDEEYKSITLTGDTNTWESIIKDVPMYDDNGKKYTYTIREDNIDKYSKVTYDQSNLEVTNELTEIPKVTLYFTVVNGYVDPKTGQMKYDEFGLKEILKAYNVNPEDEYIFRFELENVETKKRYEGKLSTKGILEFKDIPYGEYRAVVGKDKLFEFVDMMSIGKVQGVSFKKVGNEGYITIKPTGKDIIFGAKIVNKIKVSIKNPKTGFNWLILLIIIIPIVSLYLVKNKKEY